MVRAVYCLIRHVFKGITSGYQLPVVRRPRVVQLSSQGMDGWLCKCQPVWLHMRTVECKLRHELCSTLFSQCLGRCSVNIFSVPSYSVDLIKLTSLVWKQVKRARVLVFTLTVTSCGAFDTSKLSASVFIFGKMNFQTLASKQHRQV